jgi:formate-dependent nitrite reductase membrane component NrfD
VIVCPEQAIISGDLEDPTSQISKLVGRENVQARKPEKGTKPQLYYLGADQTALNPESTPQPVGYMWSEPNTRLHGRTEVPEPVTMPFRPLNFSELLVNPAPAEIRGESSFSTLPPPPGRTPIPLAQITVSTASTNGKAVADPHKSVAAGLLEGGTDAQVAYNITHEQPWGFLVALYLWTKAIAAGVILLATLALGFGLAADTTLFNMLAPVLGLVFTGLTTLLLVADLKHPERFHYILLRPNRKSWLVWGAYILIVYTAILALWLLGRLIGSSELENSLLWPGALFAGMSAVYSAFLFGQAKGRDFWQSPLLAPQLFIQAVIAGSGALLLSGAITGTNSKAAGLLMVALLVGVSSNALVVLGELFVPHLNSHVNSAANTLKSGKYSVSFWAGFGVIGGLVPIVLLAVGLASGNLIWLGAIAAAMSLVGLLVYENLWIKAGQSVPLS